MFIFYNLIHFFSQVADLSDESSVLVQSEFSDSFIITTKDGEMGLDFFFFLCPRRNLIQIIYLMVWDDGESYKTVMQREENWDRERKSRCQSAEAASLYSDLGNRWREVSAVFSGRARLEMTRSLTTLSQPFTVNATAEQFMQFYLFLARSERNCVRDWVSEFEWDKDSISMWWGYIFLLLIVFSLSK